MTKYVVRVGDKYLTAFGNLTGDIQCAQRYKEYADAEYMAEEKGGEVVEVEE